MSHGQDGKRWGLARRPVAETSYVRSDWSCYCDH